MNFDDDNYKKMIDVFNSLSNETIDRLRGKTLKKIRKLNEDPITNKIEIQKCKMVLTAFNESMNNRIPRKTVEIKQSFETRPMYFVGNTPMVSYS